MYEQEKNNIDLARSEYRPRVGINIRYIQYDLMKILKRMTLEAE